MKYVLIGLASLAILITGAFFLRPKESPEPAANQAPQASTEQQTQEPAQDVEPAAVEEMPRYIDYDDTVIADNADKKIVLFFHAEWCPNCRELEKTFLESEIPSNMIIVKVNYDQETELKQKYGVTQQTTMVQVDGDGNKQTLWIATAFDEISDIQEQII